MKETSTLLARIYRLKLLVVGVTLALLGLVVSIVADGLDPATTPHSAIALLRGLSDVLLVTGAIGVAVELFTGRDKEAADTERMRSVLKEMTPEFRDAVIAGFANTPDNMRGVATDETLDKLATNALALRLGDAHLASELYAEVRDQAIGASERWYDVVATVRLSSIDERSTSGAPLFDVIVEWEYTTAPAHAVRTFACVSDREEARDLSAMPATSTWFMAPRPGLDARHEESFKLLYFAVDGEPLKPRRQQRRSGQSYVVRLDDEVVGGDTPVRIRHIYRARTAQSGHYLFIEMPQLARGLDLTVDYDDTDIVQLRVTDLLTGSQRSQVVRRSAITGEKSVSVDHAGWVLPKAGVAIAWTLLSEEAAAPDEAGASAA